MNHHCWDKWEQRVRLASCQDWVGTDQDRNQEDNQHLEEEGTVQEAIGLGEVDTWLGRMILEALVVLVDKLLEEEGTFLEEELRSRKGEEHRKEEGRHQQ
jgi:hypothetical protein